VILSLVEVTKANSGKYFLYILFSTTPYKV